MKTLSRMLVASMVLGGVYGPSVSGDFVEGGTRGTRERKKSPRTSLA